MAGGCLYVCATPIGNLEDITLRALRVLGEADLVAAEDTRRTRQLLTHYDISTPLISLHEHNEAARAESLTERLVDGQTIVLVSDAGMPGISDPGIRLIRTVIDADIPLTVLPGPTAFVTALVGSGLPAERFAFEGFLPRSARTRRKHLHDLAHEPRTLIFYEAPHRVRQTLQDMADAWGSRPACVARELTKAFEQWQRAPLDELALAWVKATPRGEYVIVVSGASPKAVRTTAAADARAKDPTTEELVVWIAQAMQEGADKKTAIQQIARKFGLPRRVVYDAAIRVDGKGQAEGADKD